MSLAETRIELQRLKSLRLQGVCPATERKAEKHVLKNKKEKQLEADKVLTVKDVVDLYLTEVIEDKVITDPRSGIKKYTICTQFKRTKIETRRTLYADVVAVLGHRQADSVMRKDIFNFIKSILIVELRYKQGVCCQS